MVSGSVKVVWFEWDVHAAGFVGVWFGEEEETEEAGGHHEHVFLTTSLLSLWVAMLVDEMRMEVVVDGSAGDGPDRKWTQNGGHEPSLVDAMSCQCRCPLQEGAKEWARFCDRCAPLSRWG